MSVVTPKDTRFKLSDLWGSRFNGSPIILYRKSKRFLTDKNPEWLEIKTVSAQNALRDEKILLLWFGGLWSQVLHVCVVYL